MPVMEVRLKKIVLRLGLPPADLAPLAGDASARRFFRVAGTGSGSSAVLVVFPEGTGAEEINRFTGTGHLLREAGLPVPGIYRRTEGALLLEDLGDLLLQEAVRSRDPLPLYQEAVDLILKMQTCLPADAALNPPFDEALFTRELEFFCTHTVSGFFRDKITVSEREDWQRLFRTLSREPLQQPRVFCHRDFHSRNLMLQNDQLLIIDFQDGRAGPWTYDLVSLLEDPYVSLSGELREALKSRFLIGAQTGDYSGDFRRGYDIMALQRLLKAAGTFGFQAKIMGKKYFADYLPAALNRSAEIISGYPEFKSFRERLMKYLK